MKLEHQPSFKAEESQKMLVRFLVSYAEIAILVILEGVFMIIYHNMVIDLVRIFLFFLYWHAIVLLLLAILFY